MPSLDNATHLHALNLIGRYCLVQLISAAVLVKNKQRIILFNNLKIACGGHLKFTTIFWLYAKKHCYIILSTISWSYFIYRSICQRLTLGWLGVVITPRNMHFWTLKMELINLIFSQSQHILVISIINGHFLIFLRIY